MRVQTALEVTEDIFRDLDDALIPSKLDDLVEALGDQIGSPTEENQKRVADLRDDLLASLQNSRFNDYPPSLQLALEEMEVSHLLGVNLRSLIEQAFSGNELTPASAKDKIENIRDRVKKLWSEAEQFGISADYFELRPDEAKFNEYEFAIVIPRAFVNNELDDFGTELKKLDRIFSVFCEIATGSREDFKIKAISSSDLTIILESAPATALVIATALERIATFYEKVLNIIVLQRQVAKVDGMPDKISTMMQEHIDAQVKAGLEKITKDIEKEFYSKVEQGRKHELRNELGSSLSDIARRFDSGFLFDVRGGEPEESANDDETEAPPQKEMERLRRIQQAREKLRLFKVQSEPVLRLSHNEDQDE